MNKALYNLVMNIKSAHSVALQKIGFSKEFARSTPVHKLLTAAAYNLCK